MHTDMQMFGHCELAAQRMSSGE